METKPVRPAAPAQPMPGIGLGRDMTRLKTDGRATAAELREFVHQLRGRPANEVLGLVAESGLFQATVTATIGTLVLMAIFTAGPYAWSKAFPEPPKKPKGDAAAAAAPAKDILDDNTTAAKKKPSADDETTDRGNSVLDKMGESETRNSDPKKNPLEDSADDLLKELK